MLSNKSYTIAQASQQLADILSFVEQGHSVELTQHGKSVAMVMPVTEYQSLHALPQSDFWQALQEFRCQYIDDLVDSDEVFADIRETFPGREMAW